MSDNTGNSSREKTTQWLAHVLQTYYTYLERKKRGSSSLSSQGNSGDDNGASSTASNLSGVGPPPADSVSVNVLDFDIGPGFEGDEKISTLSDLLALYVRYKLNGSDDEKTENWIVKIPPNDTSDRRVAQTAQVDKREIHFYTEALPEIEEWLKSRNADLTVSVPRCYFARYHTTEPQEGEDGDSAPLSDAESVLVLEDMRPRGFSMSDFNSGLSLDEAFAAVREIAKIHAVSWAMQEATNQALDDKWPFAYRTQTAASTYKGMIEQGFPTLAEFLERQQPDGPEILDKLKALHPEAGELLRELLKPPDPPAPSCLTHMDFWCNNLLFRRRTPPDGIAEAGDNGNVMNGHASAGEESSSDRTDTTECFILDWQMIAISRPTHDIALLLLTSLTPELRRANTEALLKHYWNVFQDTAAKLKVEIPFDYGLIEHEFKRSQILALFLVIGSIELALESPVTQRRLVLALRDMANEDLI